MPKAKEKPLTLSNLVDYNNEVLIPALDEHLVVKQELDDFKNKTLNSLDKISKKLDILIEEKVVGGEQDKRKKQFYGYVVKHLQTGQTSREELEEISKLNII